MLSACLVGKLVNDNLIIPPPSGLPGPKPTLQGILYFNIT